MGAIASSRYSRNSAPLQLKSQLPVGCGRAPLLRGHDQGLPELLELLSEAPSSGGNPPNCWPGGASGSAGGGAYGPPVARGGAGDIVLGGVGMGVKRGAPVGRMGADAGDEYDDGRDPGPRSRSIA